ncbi:MAG: gamma-glutamylcyclotransferase, partial [Bauldia sp.]
PVTVIGGDSGPVVALAYVVDRGHEQYAGSLPQERLLEIVRVGEGRSGANVEYVRNTARHLRQLGIRDPVLEKLAEALGRSGASGRERGHR